MVKFHLQPTIPFCLAGRYNTTHLYAATASLGRLFIGALVVAGVPAVPIVVQAQPVQPVAVPESSTANPAGSDSTIALPQNLVLGVVQTSENRAYWPDIVDRLESSGVAYRVIDWQQVQRDTALTEITTLFLPDVKEISADQMVALQSWLDRGGGLIVSGAIGSASAPEVRRTLQSLLGAYWASTLETPAQLQPVVVNSQRWLRNGNTNDAVVGGTLVPTNLAGQAVATWRSTPDADATSNSSDPTSFNQVAIVITRQTTFLGWNWGDPNSASTAFDSNWLQATLSRFGGIVPQAIGVETASRRQPTTSSRQPIASSRQQAETQEEQNTTAVSPPASIANPQFSVQPPRPDLESAPPGLVVEPGTRPISLVEEVAMRQELENLIGRFESAVLAADAAQGDANIAQTGAEETRADRSEAEVGAEAETEAETDDADDQDKRRRSDENDRASRRHRHRDEADRRSRANSDEENADAADEMELTASADPDQSVSLAVEAANAPQNEILSTAQSNLDQFSALVRQRDYVAARETWLETQQLLWDHLPTDRPLAQTEVRAVWLDRETIVEARSKQGLARIFDQLAESGINTVFFETVNAGYPIYPSEVAPQSNPLTRRWDPLEAAVELAHERNMELHAWVWTFAAGNGDHNLLVNLPIDYPGPVIAAHPNWAGADDRGSITMPGHDEPFLDPANPAVRRYLQQLFTEIVTRYDVDGLQLDYIRYPFQTPTAGQTYGYGIAARRQFEHLTGVDPVTISATATDARSRQLWQQWTEFRVNQVNSFVAETAENLRQLRPDLILSAAVFPMPEAERIQKIQQNWEVWAEQGDIDLIVVMTYATDTNRLQQLANPWIMNETRLGSTLIIPGIRILNLPDALVFDQIQALRDSSAEGYSLFAVAHLRDSLQGILNRTQSVDQPEPIPYRQPYDAAVSQFTTLQREWNYLLGQGQLWMRQPEREAWQTQSTALEEALTRLTENPSEQNLEEATELLQDFRDRFADWMYLQALTAEYRVQTWQNRLASLATLLNYGERRTAREQSAPRSVSRRAE